MELKSIPNIGKNGKVETEAFQAAFQRLLEVKPEPQIDLSSVQELLEVLKGGVEDKEPSNRKLLSPLHHLTAKEAFKK